MSEANLLYKFHEQVISEANVCVNFQNESSSRVFLLDSGTRALRDNLFRENLRRKDLRGIFLLMITETRSPRGIFCDIFGSRGLRGKYFV